MGVSVMPRRISRSVKSHASRTLLLVVLILGVMVLAVGLAACGSKPTTQTTQTQGAQGGKQGGTLYVMGDYGLPWPSNFNPLQYTVFTPTYWGLIYEPLWIMNSFSQPGGPKVPSQYPWLATSYKWSNDNRTLTFTIRKGVKWSDGQPFTAADVVFTFNYIKKYPACDVGNAWASLDGVRQDGPDTVTFSVKPGSIPGFQAIACNTYIIPEHIWDKISNPVKYVCRKPVGTGPFLLVSSSPQVLVYKRNPNYWQQGKPYLDKIVMPDYTSNNTCNADLSNVNSQTQNAAGEQFIPNIEQYYISKDAAHRHYWFPSVNNWSLFPNLTQNPFLKNPLVRQAISYAINRSEVSQKAEFGYAAPASQTGVLTRYTSWYDKQADAQYGYYHYDPSKAESLLEQAGFTKGSDGYFHAANGQQLKLSIICASAFSDSVSACQIMAENLQAVGINASEDPLAMNTFYSRSAAGQFDLAWQQVGYGYVPYYELDYMLGSKYALPIGQPATANYERWKDAETDKLLTDYANTTDSTVQHKAVDGLQEIMLKDVPVIPILQGVVWAEWSDTNIVGWPTQANPYCNPGLYIAPDLGVELTQLHLR